MARLAQPKGGDVTHPRVSTPTDYDTLPTYDLPNSGGALGNNGDYGTSSSAKSWVIPMTLETLRDSDISKESAAATAGDEIKQCSK